MARSTATFIAYDVRPAKQTERRGIVEFFNSAKYAGYDVSRYRYVGFGGTKFIDFQLMERYVGFSKYISVEQDEDVFARCQFNRPFEFIQMYSGAFGQFQAADNFNGNTAYWLDYEIGLRESLVEDLTAFASRAKDGDLLLTTIKADLPKGRGTPKQILKSRLPGISTLIDALGPESFLEKNAPSTTGILLLALLQKAFAARIGDGAFQPHFRVIYSDSMWMCTVGGVFAKHSSRKAGRFRRSLRHNLPEMCPTVKGSFYSVPIFNFTDLERRLLDKSNIASGRGYARRLRQLGIPEEELVSYEKISRFVPRYIESVF